MRNDIAEKDNELDKLIPLLEKQAEHLLEIKEQNE